MTCSNFTGKCLFCEADASIGTLNSCETFRLDQRIRKIARKLGDEKLLAKLSEGDLVAIETKYHLNCLTKLYNRYHNYVSKTKSCEKSDQLEIIRGMAFFWK